MKKLTTLFLAIMMTTCLFAQNMSGKISGTVTSDGQPLVGANVTIGNGLAVPNKYRNQKNDFGS